MTMRSGQASTKDDTMSWFDYAHHDTLRYDAFMHDAALKLVQNQLGEDAAELFSSLLSADPQKADAIVLLQGNRLERIPKVVELFHASLAPLVLITGNSTRDVLDATLPELQDALMQEGISNEGIIVDDQAMNTRDQAENTIKRAKKEQWAFLLAVASPYHVLRSYLTFVKQAQIQEWKGVLTMQVSDPPWDPIPQGREISSLALLEEDIQKIGEYVEDVASIEEGLAFLPSHSQ
jgi:hypothetical protein